jgi:hypothetical protein
MVATAAVCTPQCMQQPYWCIFSVILVYHNQLHLNLQVLILVWTQVQSPAFPPAALSSGEGSAIAVCRSSPRERLQQQLSAPNDG